MLMYNMHNIMYNIVERIINDSNEKTLSVLHLFHSPT